VGKAAVAGSVSNCSKSNYANASKKHRIATWNVRSLFAAGKLHNAVQEMKRLKIDIMGVCETRWPGSGKVSVDKHTMYYVGAKEEDRHHRNGVAFIVGESLRNSVRNVIPVSERIIAIQLACRPKNVNIIQIYAPTTDRPEAEVEEFYDQLSDLLRKFKPHEVNIVAGDFNAKVGENCVPNVVGDYGLGVRNERGDTLVQWCMGEGFTIKNTYFKLHPRRLYTWKSPQDCEGNVVRNQIDYFLIQDRYKNSITRVAAYPGADIGSDHNPLIADMAVRLKKAAVAKPVRRFATDRLRNADTKKKFMSVVEERLKDNEHLEEETEWCGLREVLTETAKEELGYSRIKKSKPWMNNGILDLMEQRRKAKTQGDPKKYRQLYKQVRKEIRKAKETWIEEECREAEEILRRHDSFNFHKKLKQMTGTGRKRTLASLYAEDGLVVDTEELRQYWKKYAEALFQDEINTFSVGADISGPEILEEEVAKARRNMKNGKAPGDDQITVELIGCVSIKLITKLFNRIYNSGKIPEDWLKSTFITLPKKTITKTGDDYRLISLMSHMLKLFLRVIHARLYSKCEEISGDSQYGFKKGLGCREAIFGLKMCMQKCYDMRKNLFICFVDYRKAFDTIKHAPLMKLLKEVGVDGKDLRIINNLYKDQYAQVRLGDNTTTEAFKIRKGVRQGCILSPMLFNMYLERIFQIALEGSEIGLKVNGLPISNLRYADDTALLAESIEDLQELVNRIDTIGREWGLSINVEKTKYMVVSRYAQMNIDLKVGDRSIEKVSTFKYLGSLVTEKCTC
jgi:exonuclease III